MSMTSKFDVFAEEVLGRDAWAILRKSVADELHGALAPRIVLGWLRENLNCNDTLQVPGTTTKVSFLDTAEVSNWSMINSAARICTDLGCQPSQQQLSKSQAGRLGKAVDDLIRRRKKVVDVKPAELEKVDLPGKMAAPWGPKEPEKPTPQGRQAGKGQSKPVEPPKLTRSEEVTYRQLQQPCWRCGVPQMNGIELRGCMCTARMLKSENVFFGARGSAMVLVGSDAVVTEILATLT